MTIPNFKPFLATLIASIVIVVCLYQSKVDKLLSQIETLKTSNRYCDSIYNENLKILYSLDTNYYFVNKNDLKLLKRVNK